MNNPGRYITGIALAAVLGASGCVTKGTYEKLQTEKNEEIAALKTEQQALEQKRTELQEQIQALEAQRGALEAQRVALEQEKSQLLAAGQKNQEQYNALVHNLT